MIKDLIASGIDILILEASENQEVVANKAAEWIKNKMKVTKKSQENKKNENDKEMQWLKSIYLIKYIFINKMQWILSIFSFRYKFGQSHSIVHIYQKKKIDLT